MCRYKSCVLTMGDLIDTVHSHKSQNFNIVIFLYCLWIHNLYEADTFLDLITALNPQDIIHHGQITVTDISNHDLVY